MLIDKLTAIVITEEDITKTLITLEEKITALAQAKTSTEQTTILEEINACRNHYLSLYWLSYIGYLQDITSPKYLASEELISKYDGKYHNAIYKMYDVLDSLKDKDTLLKLYGKRFFDIAHNQKILLANNQDLFTEESRLRRQYRSIINAPRIPFQGENLSLTKLSLHQQDVDPVLRKEAYDKRYATLLELSPELTNVFQELLLVRQKIAQAANFKNYADYSFIKMNRIDYTKEDLRIFKDAIIKYFVPLREKLKQKQAVRSEEKTLSYYNSAILFKDGNAKNPLTLEETLEEFSQILTNISPDFAKIFNYMQTNGLIDLADYENKSAGGITTFIPDEKCPIFIKRYVNNSQSFITLSHEFGHSLQLYFNKDKKLHENRWPTFDICEIHSTTMELLVDQYVSTIYKTDTNKHLITHYTNLLELLIRTSFVDDFQTAVYSEENVNPNDIWKKLYHQYYPTNNYNIDYFNKGIMWQADINRIDDPFYGIDYALATIYAFSFLKNYLTNPKKTITDFITFCKVGGEIAFKDISKQFNLANPFAEQELKNLADFLTKKIDEISL